MRIIALFARQKWDTGKPGGNKHAGQTRLEKSHGSLA